MTPKQIREKVAILLQEPAFDQTPDAITFFGRCVTEAKPAVKKIANADIAGVKGFVLAETTNKQLILTHEQVIELDKSDKTVVVMNAQQVATRYSVYGCIMRLDDALSAAIQPVQAEQQKQAASRQYVARKSTNNFVGMPADDED